MTCRELLDALDSGASPAQPALAGHLAGCAECRAAVVRWQSTQEALRSLGAEDPPPFLHARVMATLRAERSRRTRRAPWALRVAWAGPALVLAFVALLAGQGLWRSATERPGEMPRVPVTSSEIEPPSEFVPGQEAPPVAAKTLPVVKKETTVTARTPEAEARGTGTKGAPLPGPAATPAQPLGDLEAVIPPDEKETSATSETSAMAAQAREESDEGAPGSKGHARDFALRAAAAPPAALAGATSDAVPWALVDAASGIRREVPPPPAGTLPGPGPWRLEVGADGSLTITAAGLAGPVAAPSDELLRWVSSLSLAPGTHVLTPPR